MTTLTASSIASYAKGAGFPESTIPTAVAIALAESGGNPAAQGDVGLENSTWGPSVGLWQVRSLKAQSGTGQSRDATRLTDPAFNAKSAYAISSGGKNWTPWTTYTDGAYLAHLPAAKSGTITAKNASWIPIPVPGLGVIPMPAPDGSGSLSDKLGGAAVAGGDAATALGSLAKSWAAIASTEIHAAEWAAKPQNWTRVAFVIVGAAACVAGLVLLANSGTVPGADAAKSVAKHASNTVAKGKQVAESAAVAAAA